MTISLEETPEEREQRHALNKPLVEAFDNLQASKWIPEPPDGTRLIVEEDDGYGGSEYFIIVRKDDEGDGDERWFETDNAASDPMTLSAAMRNAKAVWEFAEKPRWRKPDGK